MMMRKSGIFASIATLSLGLALSIAGLSCPAFAGTSHGVGNPGNAFDVAIVGACEHAYRMVESSFWLDRDVDADLKTFLNRHADDLRRSLQACDLRFTESEYPIELPDVTPSCARTNVSPELADDSSATLDSIYLSRPTCLAQGLTAASAITLLLHENIHHLVDQSHSNRPDSRISDEHYCNSMADAIQSAWSDYVNSRPLRWSASLDTATRVQGREGHTSTLVKVDGDGEKVVIWGGCYGDEDSLFGCNKYLRSGVVFSSDTRQLSVLDSDNTSGNIPDERAYHSAVWTGSDARLPHKLIIWGGCNGTYSCFNSLDDGGIFDPTTNVWSTLLDSPRFGEADVSRPTRRSFQSAVWTPAGMFIWGGLKDFDSPVPGITPTPLGDGAVWIPDDGSGNGHWRALPTTDQPSPRSHHATTWNGTDVFIWGGCKRFNQNNDCLETLNDGARFNLATWQWYPLPPTATSPSGRFQHQAFWTGTDLLIWGGKNVNGATPSGALYSPARDEWFPIAVAPVNNLVNVSWAHDRLVAWSKNNSGDDVILEYFPPSANGLEFGGIWQILQPLNSHVVTENATFIWTPAGILHWGGATATGQYPNTGSLLKYK